MLTGTGNEIFHRVLKRTLSLHGGQSIGATGQALTHAPFGAKMLVGIPCGATAMHALDVAAKNKDFIVAQLGDAVRSHPTTIDD